MSGNDARPAPASSAARRAAGYALIALAVAVAYAVFGGTPGTGGAAVRGLMAAGVALCGLFFLRKDLPPSERLILAVMAAGAVLRIGYMLYTSFLERGHDIAQVDEYGHYGYMYILYATGALPGVNTGQFYHPPLQHVAQALVVRAFSLFQPSANPDRLFEAAKIVPCFASCALLQVCRRICAELRLSGRAAAPAMAVIAFHPTFYILSANVNNDALMLLFLMTAALYAIRWYRRPTMKNILLIGISAGLSMMAKLSGGGAALLIGPVFLAALVRRIRERRGRSLAGQFAAFAAVSFPLGLWYPVRNYLLFGQSPGYVLRLPAESALYCGGRSLAERFFSFPLRELFDPVFCQPAGDCNVWLYLLKSSLFGEYAFDQSRTLAVLLIAVNLVLVLASLAAMAWAIVRPGGDRFGRRALAGLWLAQMASYIAFNLRYPYGCTMDFRYLMPTAVTGAVYLGAALGGLREKGGTAARLLYGAGCGAIALFCLCSALFYMV